MGKLPGKTAYSERRRPMTRQSGNATHPDTTGGEWKTEASERLPLSPGKTLHLTFTVPAHEKGQWIAFGGWFCAPAGIRQLIVDMPCIDAKFASGASPDWSKFGSMWRGDGSETTVVIGFESDFPCDISVWRAECGVVAPPGCHSAGTFEECTAPSYLKDMHLLSPEAHFWTIEGNVHVSYMETPGERSPVYRQEQYQPSAEEQYRVAERELDVPYVVEAAPAEPLGEGWPVTLKSCNRCGRYLPINTHDERAALSFSNHCLARAPCRHATFGRLRHVETGEVLQLHYGYQLECRFCKKYCVNAALNKLRTPAQMKEDGARRRHFEFLIAELFQESRQMAFKRRTGRELTDYIWEKFGRQCFCCKKPLSTARSMHLDHTRPLALLWPLDETATALCGSCNSSKSDRYPGDFYTPEKLQELSAITGISLEELLHPVPNPAVIAALVKRVEWFFGDFLSRREMVRELDGKITAELVVKALQKALDGAPGGAPLDLVGEYRRRRLA